MAAVQVVEWVDNRRVEGTVAVTKVATKHIKILRFDLFNTNSVSAKVSQNLS